MWIQAPERYVRINPEPLEDTPDGFDDPVEFSKNGTANVSEPVAEYLIENYDEITENEDN